MSPMMDWNALVENAGDAAQAFTPIPAGSYDFLITEAKYKPSSTGKDGYNIKAVVQTGPYAKRVVWNTFYVSPDSPTALGIFFRQMAALGLDANFWRANPNNDQIVAALLNKPFTGTVIEKVYEGKPDNELKNVAPPRPGVVVAQPGVPGVPTGVPAPAPVAAPAPPVPAAPAPAPVAAPPAPAPVAPAPVTAAPPPAPAPPAPAQGDPWAAVPAPPAQNDPWTAPPPAAPPVSPPTGDQPPF